MPTEWSEEISSALRAHARRLARALQRRLAAAASARLRRALPAPVELLPRLLGGRLSRAADPRPADRAREARPREEDGRHGRLRANRLRRASRPDPRPRRVAADLEPGDRPARRRARRDRRRHAGLRRFAAAAGGAAADRRPARGGGRRALRRRSGFERPHLGGNSLGAWAALELAKAGRAAASVLRDLTGRALATPARPARASTAAGSAGACDRCCRCCCAPPGCATALLRTTIARPERLTRAEAKGLVVDWLDSPGYDGGQRARCAPTSSSIPSGSRCRPRSPGARRIGSSRRPGPSGCRPDSRYVVLEGCGHTPTWDDPDLVAELLLESSSGEAAGAGTAAVTA